MQLDSAAIRCPRCATSLEAFSRATESGAVIANMCLRCGGVWLDGAVVAKAYPAFADLDDRVRGTLAVDFEKHIHRCPRCGTPPVGFGFFDLALDHCPGCFGLWVDGDELAALAQTADRADGLPAPAPGSYRTNAAGAVGRKAVPCKSCSADVALEAAELTAEGPMCAPCARRHRETFLDHTLADYDPPKNLALPTLDSMRSVFGAIGRAIDDALNAPPRCDVCDCHAHSRCAHRRGFTSED